MVWLTDRLHKTIAVDWDVRLQPTKKFLEVVILLWLDFVCVCLHFVWKLWVM